MNASIRGRIVDEKGTPLTGVRVREVRRAVPNEAVTDAEGRFRMTISLEVPDLFAPLPRIYVEGPAIGLPRQSIDDLRISACEETDIGDVVVDNGVRFSARAVDEKGHGIPSAKMSITLMASTCVASGHPVGEPWSVTADEEGRFEMNLPRADLHLLISARGHSRHAHLVRSAPQEALECAPFVLKAAPMIEGVVVDADGRGIEAEIFSMDEYFSTDAEGRFAVDDPGEQQSTIEVRAGGYLKRTVPIEDVRSGAPIVLERSRHLVVRVEDATTGGPVGDLELMLCRLVPNEGGQKFAVGCGNHQKTDVDGRFLIHHDIEGEHRLTVEADGYAPFEAEIVLPHDEEEFVARLSPLGQVVEAVVSGSVIRVGTPAAGVRVFAMKSFEKLASMPVLMIPTRRGATVAIGIVVGTAETDREGRYRMEFPEGARGSVRIAAISPDACAYGAMTEIVSGREVEATPIEMGAVFDFCGRVIGRAAEERRGLWIVAFDGILSFTTRVRADGTFAFHGLPPGRWGLRASRDRVVGYEPIMGRKGRDPWIGALTVELGEGRVATHLEIADVFDPMSAAPELETPA